MNGRAYKAAQSPESPEQDDKVLEPGAFPLEALSRSARDIATEAAEVYQIDPALPGMGAVGILAGAIGKGHVVTGALNGRNTPMNLMVLGGADRGYGKLGASITAKPLVDASNEMAQHFRENERPGLMSEKMVLDARIKVLINTLAKDGIGRGTPLTSLDKQDLERELTEKQQRLQALEDSIFRVPTYWIGQATTPAFVDCLMRNGETTVSFSPEAGPMVRAALGSLIKGDTADIDLYLSGYSNEPYRETRVGRGDNSLEPCISLVWYAQPMLMHEIFSNEESVERGLIPRMLCFICEHDQIPEDDGIHREVSSETSQRWNRLVRDVLSGRPTEPVEIPCSPEAREAFRQFHNESVKLRNGQYRESQGELSRWRENAVRLAGGLVIADHYEQGAEGALRLTLGHAQRGIRLARWACLSTLKIIQRSREEKQLNRMEQLETLVKSAGGEITLRDLERSHGFDHAEVKKIAVAYPRVFDVRTIKPETGRPSEVLLHVELMR